jgi:hypothetical protein
MIKSIEDENEKLIDFNYNQDSNKIEIFFEKNKVLEVENSKRKPFKSIENTIGQSNRKNESFDKENVYVSPKKDGYSLKKLFSGSSKRSLYNSGSAKRISILDIIPMENSPYEFRAETENNINNCIKNTALNGFKSVLSAGKKRRNFSLGEIIPYFESENESDREGFISSRTIFRGKGFYDLICYPNDRFVYDKIHKNNEAELTIEKTNLSIFKIEKTNLSIFKIDKVLSLDKCLSFTINKKKVDYVIEKLELFVQHKLKQAFEICKSDFYINKLNKIFSMSHCNNININNNNNKKKEFNSSIQSYNICIKKEAKSELVINSSQLFLEKNNNESFTNDKTILSNDTSFSIPTQKRLPDLEMHSQRINIPCNDLSKFEDIVIDKVIFSIEKITSFSYNTT